MTDQIDRGDIAQTLAEVKYAGVSVLDGTDKIVALMQGDVAISLSVEEAVTARFAIEYTRHRAVLGARDQAHMKALEAKLEAAS